MGIPAWVGRQVGELVGSYRAAATPKAIPQDAQLLRAQFTPYELDRGVAQPQAARPDVTRYAASDDVRAAVSLIADNASDVPLLAHRIVPGEEKPVPEPEHELSLLLARGNPDDGGKGLWTAVYSFLLTTGECALPIRRDNPVNRGMPNALRAMPGDRWRVYPGTDGWIDHFAYVPKGHSDEDGIPFVREDVVWLKLWNPLNPLRGLSPLSALRLNLDGEQAAKESNLNIFRRGYQIGGIVTMPNATPQQLDHFRDQLRRRSQGVGNAHDLLFTGASEATFERMALTPSDMEFLELDKATTRDVAKVYRVPEPYLGLLDHATLQNMESLDRFMWEAGILPRVRWVCNLLTLQIASQYPDAESLVVLPDTRDVDALADVARANEKFEAETDNAKSEAFERLAGSGVSPAAAGVMLFGERLDPVAFGPVPAKAAPTPAKGYRLSYAPPGVTRTKAAGDDEEAQADQVRAGRADLFPRGLLRINDALHEQLDRALAEVARRFGVRSYEDDVADAAMAAAMAGADPLQAAMAGFIAESATTGATVTVDVYGLGANVHRVTQQTQEWADASAAHRVAWVNNDTREQLRRRISAVLAEGGGQEAVRQAIRDGFLASSEPEQVDAYAGRVENITQTELNRAYNHGSDAAMQDAGIGYRRWRYSGLPDSRHGPHPPNGIILPFGTPFNVNGFSAQTPSADSLPPGEACRCRCIVVPSTAEAYRVQHPAVPGTE